MANQKAQLHQIIGTVVAESQMSSKEMGKADQVQGSTHTKHGLNKIKT